VWQPPTPVYRFTSVLFSILFLLSLITLGRTIRTSLPGSPMHPAKIFVEDLQGYLMTAAGQRALWHARQVEWRLQELDQLARQGAVTDMNLVTEIEENVQSALVASASLPAAERTRFLQTWLAQLDAARPATATQSTTVITLSRVIATVETAAEQEITPTTVQEVATPTNTPLPATDTPTVEPSPTATLTANPGRVLLPTPTNTPAISPSPVVNPPQATASVLGETITPAPQDFDDVRPAPTALIQQIPQSSGDEPREDSSPAERATDTPVPPTPAPTNTEILPTNTEAPPTATFTLLPPTATWTAVPTNTPRPTATTVATTDEPANTPTVMRTPSTTPEVIIATPPPLSTTPAAGTNTPAATATASANATLVTASTAVPISTRTPDPSPTPAPTTTPAPTNTPAPTPPPPSPTPAPTATQAAATPTIAPTTDGNDDDEDEEPTATAQPVIPVNTPIAEAVITSAPTPTKRPRN
jgi:hypothetical protein